MTAQPRFRRVTRFGPVQVGTYYDGRGREKHTAACTAPAVASPPTTTPDPPPNSPPGRTAARCAERSPTVTVNLPLVVVLGLIAWGAVKFLGVRLWIVIVIALFGFYLADTFLAPAIDSGTRSGVEIVNGNRH